MPRFASAAVSALFLCVAASAAAQPPQLAADGLSSPTALAPGAHGQLYVVEAGGRLLELRDHDGDGYFDRREVKLDGIAGLSGLASDAGGLWLAAGERLMWWPQDAAQAQILASDLPPAPETHRPLAIGPDGRVYIGGRATLARFDPRDADLGTYATGLSAATGFGWHPETLGFWGVDQGAPGGAPAELNRLVIANDYGWPCPEACGDTTGAALTLTRHPTAMVFLSGDAVPDAFRGDAVMAVDGPQGPGLLRVDFDDRGAPAAVLPFAAGIDWGRIGGLALDPTGAVLVADSGHGLIRRVAAF